MALIQFWPLNDNAASTTVAATVGTNATLAGGDNTSAKTTAGPGGSITLGLLLNGSDDHINFAASSVSLPGLMSGSIWFKRTGVVARLIGAAITSVGRIFALNDTTIRVVSPGGVNHDFTVPSMGTTNWHHLLVTRNGSDAVQVFLDGVESSTGDLTIAGTFAWDSIGQSAGLFTNGHAAAQFKIFDSDESANVAALYAEGSGGGPTPLSPPIFRRPTRFFTGR